MLVTVDFDACMSTGGCTQLAPSVFEIRDDGYLYVLVDEPGPELHDDVRTAADLCPTGAITLDG
ncbi:MAG TPA: ferredoxin [Ilumatobacter sp.]|nr:ferredoxin [Ilumatobacter sp.]